MKAAGGNFADAHIPLEQPAFRGLKVEFVQALSRGGLESDQRIVRIACGDEGWGEEARGGLEGELAVQIEPAGGERADG